MKTTIRVGAAVTAAAAFTLAWAGQSTTCDTRGYDPATDRPRERGCPTTVIQRGAPPRLKLFDLRMEEDGGGSGEPESGRREDAFLEQVWAGG